MVNPLRIGYENDIDIATVSASTAIASLPAANVKDEDIQRVWRATTSPAYLIADISQTLTLEVTAWINTSQRSNDTVQVRASITDSTVTSDLTYDSGVIASEVDPIWGKFVHFLPSAVSYRYLRIDTTQTDTPEVGRWMAGQVWSPSRDMSFGREKLWRDFSTRARSLGGNEFVDVKHRQWGWRFILHGLTETEAQAQVDELNRLRGIGRDILVCVDKDSSNLGRDTVWGLLEEPARQRQDHRDFYTVEFEVWNRN